MSFTCPDCLRTTRLPEDVAHNYCPRCHVFQPGPSLLLTPFQTSVVIAVYHPDPQMALSQVQHTVAWWRMQLETFEEITEELTALLGAKKLPMECQQLIHLMLWKIARATNNGLSIPPR